jgi:hypothetical protein
VALPQQLLYQKAANEESSADDQYSHMLRKTEML